MKERPIIFSGPMVRAILDGRKTQTRRVVKNAPFGVCLCHWSGTGWAQLSSFGGCSCNGIRPPYGDPGDRLWVRETFIHEPADYCWEASVSIPCRPASTVYRADQQGETQGAGWTPSIFMPRSLSRILLEVTSVRVERLQDISEDDCIAEGVEVTSFYEEAERLQPATGGRPGRYAFRSLWEEINGAEAWDFNPWVWVISFQRLL